MSPREQPSVSGLEDWHGASLDDDLLREYAISCNGFLPGEPPLERLPDAYYAPWESLVASLPASLERGTLRSQVDSLPVLSTARLVTEPEWRRAYVVLGFLAHAYIWGGDRAAEVLPPPITVPFLSVARHLDMPPVATYAALNLWNFGFRTGQPAAGDPRDLDSLRALHTFTGSEDESWFYVVSVAMEAVGGGVVAPVLRGLEAAWRGVRGVRAADDYRAARDGLAALTDCVGRLGGLLARMHDRCDPVVFFRRVRPFLAGSRNMAAAGLPRGVFYDEGGGGGGGKGAWRQLRGGSNGQSSLIQFLDLALGVEHDDGAGSHFHDEVRGYMPAAHRRFLRHVAERYPGGMRKAVAELVAAAAGGGGGDQHHDDDPELLALVEAFQTATKALAEFRNQHLRIVARYVIIPSRQQRGSADREGVVNLATASSGPAADGPGAGGELTGTGGTALLPFLKQARDKTLRAGELGDRRC